jgi:DNA-binding XRE family transcriptional regulator
MAFSVLEEIERAQEPISATQLARILGVSRQAIHNLKNSGKIAPIDIGLRADRYDPKTLAWQLRKLNPAMRLAAGK